VIIAVLAAVTARLVALKKGGISLTIRTDWWSVWEELHLTSHFRAGPNSPCTVHIARWAEIEKEIFMLGEIFGVDGLVVVIVLAVVLFGGAAIPKLARNLGSAKNQFEKGLEDGKKATAPATVHQVHETAESAREVV
jgi:Sec-independent protein translocase protein TatA